MTLTFPLLAAAVAALVPFAVLADGDRPSGDFTFKRIGLPPADADRRITVQIEPKPEVEDVIAPSAEPGQGAETGAGYDWFWTAVSPALADTGPGRLQQAEAGLRAAPGGDEVRTPPLQHLSDIAALYGTDILLATVGTRVSPALVLAMISVESAGRPDAVSAAGAVGLMQLIPDTAARFGVSDPGDAAENIRGGVAYLDWLMEEFAGDPVFVLAGYNAGEGAVRAHAGVPPYEETRGYVPKVIAAWGLAKGLCLTPPELISDGCVFAVASRGG